MHQAWQEWRYESFFLSFSHPKNFPIFSWKMQSMLYLFNQNWNRNKKQTKCTFTYFCSYCALPKVLSKLSLEVFKTSKSKVGKSYCPPNRSKLSLTKCETCQWKIWKLTNRWSKIVKADLDHWHQIEGNWWLVGVFAVCTKLTKFRKEENPNLQTDKIQPIQNTYFAVVIAFSLQVPPLKSNVFFQAPLLLLYMALNFLFWKTVRLS